MMRVAVLISLVSLLTPALSFRHGGTPARSNLRHVTELSCSNSPIWQPDASEFNDGPLGTEIGGAQYDEFPMDPLDSYTGRMSSEDEATLEEMRKERQIANDLWQSTLFRDQQGGEWIGSYELFEVKRSESGDLSVGCIDRGGCQTTMEAGKFSKQGVSISIKENYESQIGPKEAALLPSTLSKLLLQPTKSVFLPAEFRTQEGNTVVANTFTWGKVDPVYPGYKDENWDPLEPIKATTSGYPPDTYVAELGIKDGAVRTRVRYAFGKLDSTAPALTQTERESGEYVMQLLGFAIVRESGKDTSPSEMQPLLDPRAGPGIYDPQAEGEPYVQLNMPGRLSLLFPRGLPSNGRSVVTMEFEGNSMRYQADRKFINLSGAIRTLELTEIRPSDVENYPPPFVEVDLLK